MKIPIDEKNLKIIQRNTNCILSVKEKTELFTPSLYMQGLFHECKSNIERMCERVPESNYQQLQHFISVSVGSAKGVIRDVAKNTNQSFETLTGEKGLILDESGRGESWKTIGWRSAAVYRGCGKGL